MIDAVLSVHRQPLTCGVSKFNERLANHLGVPSLTLVQGGACRHPLVSVRMSEVGDFGLPAGELFLHDLLGPWQDATRQASVVYAANADIARVVRRIRPDVVEAFCPGTVAGDGSRGNLDILCFGMAHRFQTVHFERLKCLLDRHPGTYTISLSTAIHEGRNWDDDFSQNLAQMRGIFGDRLRHLGFLADDGLRRMMKMVGGIALFYEPAVRANNTSLWSALGSGVPVVTNLDADSPKELAHETNLFDLKQLEEWPRADQLRIARHGASKVCEVYSWERLASLVSGKVTA